MNDTPTPPAPDDLVSRLHGVLAADPDTKVIDIRADDARALLARIETLTAEVDNRPSWQEWKDLLAAGYEQKARAEKAEAERDAAVEALRVIAGNSCITCSADAFNVLFAMKHPARIEEKRT